MKKSSVFSLSEVDGEKKIGKKMRVGACGSQGLFLSLMNALSPVKPSMAPSPGALRIGLNDIRINGHTGVRDGFCFFKNESLTYSFYFFFYISSLTHIMILTT